MGWCRKPKPANLHAKLRHQVRKHQARSKQGRVYRQTPRNALLSAGRCKTFISHRAAKFRGPKASNDTHHTGRSSHPSPSSRSSKRGLHWQGASSNQTHRLLVPPRPKLVGCTLSFPRSLPTIDRISDGGLPSRPYEGPPVRSAMQCPTYFLRFRLARRLTAPHHTTTHHTITPPTQNVSPPLDAPGPPPPFLGGVATAVHEIRPLCS